MIKRLNDAILAKEAPIVVGLDPMLSYIPETLLKPAFEEKGETLEGAAAAVLAYNKEIVDAVSDLVPAVKPQIAMYEQFGLPGLAAFKETVDYCHQKGLIVIGDVKRGDIGSTSAAYAAAHLGRVMVGDREFAAFDEDFCTVNPYLGSDGVVPFLKECDAQDKGIFVLVKTSNPSSGEFQDRLVLVPAEGVDGASSLEVKDEKGMNLHKLVKDVDKEILKQYRVRPLYEIVGEKVAEWASEPRLIGESGYSEVGAVVGATYPEMGRKLRKIMPKSFILVPGYGAQGGKGDDLVPFFNKDGLGAVVNSSRGIIAAYTKAPYAEKYGADNYADAARAAVKDMKKDIAQALEKV
jgi:orotidine-5'-phosphate decarboxylase